MQRDFSKRQRKELRTLANEAWVRELDEALRDLSSAFSDWSKGQVDGFQLSDAIHEFHDGIARELYKRYTQLKPPEAVAYAIAQGVLERGEVADELIAQLAPIIEAFEAINAE